MKNAHALRGSAVLNNLRLQHSQGDFDWIVRNGARCARQRRHIVGVEMFDALDTSGH
jgi:hypothetical protein